MAKRREVQLVVHNVSEVCVAFKGALVEEGVELAFDRFLFVISVWDVDCAHVEGPGTVLVPLLLIRAAVAVGQLFEGFVV